MKWIDKRTPPVSFEQWKVNFTTTHGRAPIYDDLVGEPRQCLKLELLEEQGYLCCYCLARIDMWDSHIEHFIPRSAPKRNPAKYLGKDIELGYDNLFLSCEGEHFQKDRCGRYKDDASADNLLSPADPLADSVFEYTVDGHISSQNQQAANLIIAANLESKALTRHRETAIYNSGFFDDDFEDKREALIRFYHSRDDHGAFTPFCMAITYILEQTNRCSEPASQLSEV